MLLNQKIENVIKVIKGDAVVLVVEDQTLKVSSGNKSADDLKKMATTFFKTVNNLTV